MRGEAIARGPGRARPFVLAALFVLCRVVPAAADHARCDHTLRGDSDFPPYEFLNEAGRPAGFNVAILAAVAEAMGFKPCLSLGPWHEVRGQLERGEIDGLIGMYESLERRRVVRFSSPHLVVSHTILVPDDSPVRAVEDLTGRAVAVQKGDVMHDYIALLGIAGRLLTPDTPLEALRAVATGAADAALVGKLQALHLMARHDVRGLRAVGPPLEPRRYAFAVAPGREALLHRLDEGLAIIRASGRYDAIYETWFGPPPPPTRDPVLLRRFGAVSGVLLLAAGILLAWNYSLNRRVARRTAELAESESRYRTVLETAPDAVLLIGLDGRILEANPAAEALFGLPAADLAGRSPAEFSPPLQADGTPSDEAVANNAVAVMRDGILRFDWLHHRAGGTPFDAEVSLARSAIRGRPAIIATIRDVTERKRHQAELERARNQAQAASQAKSRFLATMSHELRTPLNSILGFSDIIRREFLGPCAPRRYVEYAGDIHHSGTILLDLIRDILDLSKIESGRVEVVETIFPVAEAIAEAIRQTTARPGAPVRVADDAGTRLRADRRMVVRMVTNLLGNALKFTPPDGRITVETEDAPDGGLDILVRDTGPGIAAEELERVREAFYQAGRDASLSGEGAGLGLAIVTSLIELHDGRFLLASAPGAGTTATLRFPAARVERAA